MSSSTDSSAKKQKVISWQNFSRGPETHVEHRVSFESFSAVMLMKNKEKLEPGRFTVDVFGEETEWQLKVYPNGANEEAAEHVSIHLQLMKSTKPLTVKRSFSIVGKHGERNKKTSERIYEPNSTDWGWFKFVSHKDLRNGKLGLLPNNTLTVLVDLSIVGNKTIITSGKSESLMEDESAKEKHFENISTLFNTKEMSDIVVKCGSEEFDCHKAILACQSSYFKAMFASGMKENRVSEIDITDFDGNVIASMLKFMYSGKVEDLDNQAKELLVAADKYDVAALKEMCERALAKTVKIENAVELLIFADLFNANLLREHLMDYLSVHKSKITEKDENLQKLKDHPNLFVDLLKKWSR